MSSTLTGTVQFNVNFASSALNKEFIVNDTFKATLTKTSGSFPEGAVITDASLNIQGIKVYTGCKLHFGEYLTTKTLSKWNDSSAKYTIKFDDINSSIFSLTGPEQVTTTISSGGTGPLLTLKSNIAVLTIAYSVPSEEPDIPNIPDIPEDDENNEEDNNKEEYKYFFTISPSSKNISFSSKL